MTIKVISFLGTAVRPASYDYRGQIYEGSLFQIALRQFIPFDELLVFVTPQALEKSYPTLAALADPRIRPVDIRLGRTSAGLWQIFSALVENVAQGDRVIFDITHGLRSIPFLTFLAAAYLRSAKDVKIEAVLYGAFELGMPAPVIELTEFVDLLDWLMATNQFIKTGNAADLAACLSQTEHPAVQKLAQTVEGIAAGLHLLRPFETSQAAAELGLDLAALRPALPPPFTVLADSLLQSYGRFGRPGSDESGIQLRYHLEMVNWYHQRKQVVHALSLGREWVVSLLCFLFDLPLRDSAARAEMELLLVGGSEKDKQTGQVRRSPYLEAWKKLPLRKRLLWLWGGDDYKLANLRNDVLHCGFRPNAKSSVEVLKEADKVLLELNNIALEMGLSGPEAL